MYRTGSAHSDAIMRGTLNSNRARKKEILVPFRCSKKRPGIDTILPQSPKRDFDLPARYAPNCLLDLHRTVQGHGASTEARRINLSVAGGAGLRATRRLGGWQLLEPARCAVGWE
jgi:hypothetical protein